MKRDQPVKYKILTTIKHSNIYSIGVQIMSVRFKSGELGEIFRLRPDLEDSKLPNRAASHFEYAGSIEEQRRLERWE